MGGSSVVRLSVLRGMVEPSGMLEVPLTVYVLEFCSPVTGQLAGVVQVTVTEAPPPTGVSTNV